MLIQKSPASSEIISLKLATGDEIIGKKVSENDAVITLSKIVAIHLVPMQNGNFGITFAPFMASVDDAGEVTFYKKNLLTIPTKTKDDVAATYTKMTSSITPVPASALANNGLLKT